MGLNARQRVVLQWIADGTPEREWPDWTHRSTAKALQSRGLVKVRGHGAAWTAAITERGRRVLSGEEAEPSRPIKRSSDKPDRGRGNPSREGVTEKPSGSAHPPVRIDSDDLIADLIGATDQTLQIADPNPVTRAAYRRSIAAISPDLVPAGKKVTYTGRSRGDLVIRLLDLPEASTPDPAVSVPTEVDAADPLITWLSGHPAQLPVAENSRDRALRIVQGIAAVLASRGHGVTRSRCEPVEPEQSRIPDRNSHRSRNDETTSPPEPATFAVSIGDQTLLVDLCEERDTVRIVPPEEAAKLRYDWQRATPVATQQFNGRLALRIRDHAASPGWADRKRWTLESRLPRFVRTLEEVAAARTAARERAEEQRRQRRQEWDEAVPKARTAYLADLNRTRLEKQLERFAKAQELRAYADAIAQRALGFEGEARVCAQAWAAWARTEADRHDPTSKHSNLIFIEPEDIHPWDLDKYMPYGFTAAHPPDEN